MRWTGARLRWASETMLTMRANMVSASTFSARLTSELVPFTVPPDQLVAGLLRHRHRLARHHGFVDGAGAFHDVAIDGHAIAGPHAQVIADLYLFESDFLVLASGLHTKRGLWRQLEQGADRAAGLLAGAQFQHLTQQDEDGNHGGALVIDSDSPAHHSEALGE